MRLTVVLLFLAALLTTSHARFNAFNPIQLLRPRSVAASSEDKIVSCPSWRLTMETNNRQGRSNTVPSSCLEYIRDYMLEGQYSDDCEEVANVAIEYAKSVKPAADGMDVWVFDVDETTLSNLPFYERPDVQFGVKPVDTTIFLNEWVAQGKSPALGAVQRLYNATLSLGFKNVILTGSPVTFRDARTNNLKKVGYANWLKLIFKEEHISTRDFKSKERTKLVNEGYRIVGNVGDQWGDLSGDYVGKRTFKVPNPMYYV